MSIIGVDTGGTFTDLAGWVDGELRRLKIPSTPDDPARAVVEGVRTLLGDRRGTAVHGRDGPGPRAPSAGGGGPHRIVHGSTVATNALLERTGARTALVTNRGFEDLLEIGRQNRPSLYALRNTRPPPLVAREDRVGIAGRIGPTGEVEAPLSPEELATLTERLAGVDAVAVCLLHGYAAPSQERRVADALRPLGCAVTLAAELVPEFREYERLSTAVVNAYVTPLMSRYLGGLREALGAGSVSVMGSGGGWLGVDRAAAEPVHTVLSGPAGGVMGARATAAGAGLERIITLDMGGTSTDVAICPGEPLRTRDFRIGAQPLAIDVLDIHTIGSGGGSIAWIDPAGALRVGPRSAGAVPGPACYGLGGRQATVTDAHVVLGRLPPDAFLLGGRPLDAGAAHAAVERLAEKIAVDAERAALAVVDAADAAMEAALRLVSVERGYDPADFTLVAFGGAAGLHAASLAGRVGVDGVLLPPAPGVLSAYGMVVAPARKDASRSVLWTEGADTEARVTAALDALEEEAAGALEADGFPRAAVATRRRVDARYVGQSHELTVDADGWPGRFHAAHEAAFGYLRPADAVQAVTLRVEATARTDAGGAEVTTTPDGAGAGGSGAAGEPGAVAGPATAGEPETAPSYASSRADGQDERRAPVRSPDGTIEAVVRARTDLKEGEALDGPAVLTEYSSTTWVPPGWRVLVLPSLALDLRALSGAAGTNSARSDG